MLIQLHCPSHLIVCRDKGRLFVKKGILKQLKRFNMRGYLEVASAAITDSFQLVRLDWFQVRVRLLLVYFIVLIEQEGGVHYSPENP